MRGQKIFQGEAIEGHLIFRQRTGLDGPTKHVERLDPRRCEVEGQRNIPSEQLQKLLVIDIAIGNQVGALGLPR